MARSENRTLEIRAKLLDLVTAPLGGMQGKIVAWSRRVMGSFKNVLGSVFNLKTAIVGLGASVLSLSTVKAFGEQADALLKLARSTGDTVENLSELQAAFNLAGVDAENFRSVLRALETQARKAPNDDKVAASFEAIGISLRDLRTLGPSELFEKMAAGLETYGTAQEKVVALGRVLPKQFLDSLPLLEGGLRSFQSAIKDARDSGATVTEQQAKISERLNDSLTKIEISLGGVSRALIEQFGPDAIALFEKLAKGITENKDGIVAFASAIGSGLVRAFGLATDAAIGLVGIIEMISPVSLVDQKQVAELRTQLQLIDDFRRAGSPNTGNLTSTVLTPNRDMPGIPDIGFVTKSAEELQTLTGREGEIRRRLAELEETMQLGVAGAMRRARDRLSGELASVAESIRDPQSGLSVLSPGGQVWTDIEETAANVQSVFRPTGGSGRNALAEDLDEVTVAAGKAKEASEKVTEAFHGDFWEGFNSGAKEAIVEFTNFQAAGENAAKTLILNGFNGIADAFSEIILGTKSAKEAFRDFARALLTDATRIISRLLIVRALQGATSGSDGGLLGALGLETGGVVQGTMGTPVRAYARGGVTNGPTVALFGEGKNREAFVPLPDNRSIPVTLNGAGGGDVHVHFNINTIDAKGVQQLLLEQGKTIAAVIAEQAGGRNVRFRQDMARAAR